MQLRSEAMKMLEEEGEERSQVGEMCVCACVCVGPDGFSVWRPARGTGAGHMTSRYHGDGDCSWREDERRGPQGHRGVRDGGEGSEQEGGRRTVQEREMQAYSSAEGNANTLLDHKNYMLATVSNC